METKSRGEPCQAGIFVGKTAKVTTSVNEFNTAKAVGSGSLDVFATPMMLALMEQAACQCLADALGPGQISVGAGVWLEHTAASPVGAAITATAAIIDHDGRKISFEVNAHDGKGEIGHGTHERFIVDAQRFMTKTQTRL